MQVTDILECCIYATDLEATGEFYERVLGLGCFSAVEGRHRFFRCGGRVLLLFNPDRTLRSDDVPRHGAVGPGHVAFAVEESELPAWRAHLARCGVEIETEVEWPRGGISLYLRDPAGNSVELAPARIWGAVVR
jgi:catechol 2,3-dioxygenase-like lactoylglutathione lyase family enzyme